MPQERNLSIPIAIVIAGALIAGALYLATRAPGSDSGSENKALKSLVPVSKDDHILGNPDAPVTIVEYSDLECPFCKQFHVTMKAIMEEYGKRGQVNWVYRHFPLVQLHPNAPKLAEASECIAEQLENAGFWNFVEAVFTAAPGNESFDMTKLTATAISLGAHSALFDTCLASGKYKDKVQKEFEDAIATGGQGTPYNIVVTSSGDKVALPGAQSYSTIKSVIDAALAGNTK